MSDDYGFDEGAQYSQVPPRDDPTKKQRQSLKVLGVSAGQFASAITKAFAQATTGGKQFDDVLKGLTLKLSSLAMQNAFKPIARLLAGDFKNILTDGDDGGVIKNLTPFASGGIINTPSYFPLSGGMGLAGDAGPEAIVPLSRGADGRLGVAASGGQSGNVTIHIATPDPGSFQRSEAYITGQIARAVARGQRGL
ncbi:MAG: phage tail tape measure protein [Pseudolabrys sp.]|nr:phage tail tape measure protein [Pseudolabrys sp.]